MCTLVQEAERSCLLQLELLHTSVQTHTDILQHRMQQGGVQTQAVVREESQRILQGQAHIQRALDVLLLPEGERLRLAAEASKHLAQARIEKAAASECFLLEQVRIDAADAAIKQTLHDVSTCTHGACACRWSHLYRQPALQEPVHRLFSRLCSTCAPSRCS